MRSLLQPAHVAGMPVFLLLGGLVALAFLAAAPYAAAASSAPAEPAVLECVIDSDGANDEPGQKDLTRWCNETAPAPGTLQIAWNWDEIKAGGSNTIDGCALFDTNDDGLVNYAVCNSWGGSQVQTTGYPVVYSCNNTRPYNCAGAVVVASTGTSCSVSDTSDDPFAAGSNYPRDTKSGCTISLADVGGPGATLLDVCSYPSASPTSDASDCVAISKVRANINVLKDVVPDDPTTNWNITVSGPSGFTDSFSGDGSTGIRAVNAGSYTLSEAPGANTSLEGFYTTWVCNVDGTPSASGAGTTISNVAATAGAVVSCTFTNASGFITVDKVTDPPGAGRIFVFGIAPGSDTNQPASFELTDTAPPKVIRVKPNVAAGYTVTETPDLMAGGWTLEAASCVVRGTNAPAGTVNPATGVYSGIKVAAGQYVDCTFNNKVGALAVMLTDFAAQVHGASVVLTWETGAEHDTAGFNLYRGAGQQGPWQRVNRSLIPSRAIGSATGASYSYSDDMAGLSGRVWYLLEDLSPGGVSVRHEPVMVTITAPNAIDVLSLSAEQEFPPAGIIAGALTMTVSAWLFRRRCSAARSRRQL